LASSTGTLRPRSGRSDPSSETEGVLHDAPVTAGRAPAGEGKGAPSRGSHCTIQCTTDPAFRRVSRAFLMRFPSERSTFPRCP
jgi:hypothetical protein